MNFNLIDLCNYIPKDKFDVAIFVESYCHLSNAGKVLYNISESTDKIIFREYHLKSNQYPKSYVDRWFMNIYRKEELVSLMEQLDFKLTHQEEHYDYALEPTLDLWLKNLKNVDKKDKTPHIRTLEISAKYLKKNMTNILNDIGLSTFVFQK